MTAFTALVMIYNGLVTGYTDTSGITYDPVWSSPFLPPLTLPMAVFSLTAPSLGLLLGTCQPYCFIFCVFIPPLACSMPYYCCINDRSMLTLTLLLCCFFQSVLFHSLLSPPPFFHTLVSLPYQFCIPTLGWGTEELGDEYQSYTWFGPDGECILRPYGHTGRTT